MRTACGPQLLEELVSSAAAVGNTRQPCVKGSCRPLHSLLSLFYTGRIPAQGGPLTIKMGLPTPGNVIKTVLHRRA